MKLIKKTNLFLLFLIFNSSWSIAKELKIFKQAPIPNEKKLPIVFDPSYDIGFFGIEKLHPFDSKKYGKVNNHLIEKLKLTQSHFFKPQHEVSEDDLKKVHSKDYLDSLNSSMTVARITEVAPLAILPNFILQRNLLKPMRLATQGTIDAAALALERGVGINLSGGYHHAKKESGGGFCVYADIPLAIQKLREQQPNLTVMYLDLDAHQGNGVEDCLKTDKNAYIFDCYHENNYPFDISARERIDTHMTSDSFCCDNCNTKNMPNCEQCNALYLKSLKQSLKKALTEFKQRNGKNPDIIFYNAGTDCFEEDPLGRMKLNKEGIIERDEFVFTLANQNNIPLCMTLSGGYSKRSAEIIGDSLVNLWNKNLIPKPSMQ